MARGIDIDDILCVINYDVPHDAEDYVHRIGRTARAQRDGVAITFVSEQDIQYFADIERFLEREITKTPLPEELGEGPKYNPLTARKPSRGRGGFRHGGRGKRSGHSNNNQGNSNNNQGNSNNQGSSSNHRRRNRKRGGKSKNNSQSQ